MKILLVEDNLTIAKGLMFSLEQNKYEVVSTKTVSDTIKTLETNSFDLIILDINLPDGNGFDLYKIIHDKYNIPTIFLTVKDLEEDIVHGFSLGCEDYVAKPFKVGELLARINKILSRNKKKNIIQVDNIKLDLDKMIVLKNNQEITLTTLEYKIFLLLMENINKVITRDIIIDKIFELTGNDVYDNTVTVYIKRIREKLDTNIIKTIKGIGYRIDEK